MIDEKERGVFNIEISKVTGFEGRMIGRSIHGVNLTIREVEKLFYSIQAQIETFSKCHELELEEKEDDEQHE